MNTIAISEATTAQLVAYYNTHIVMFADGTVIKKFADRKKAEARVLDLAERVASHFPNLETPEGFIPNPDFTESDTQESTDADGAATDDQTTEGAAPASDMDGAQLTLEPSDQPTDAERAAAEESEHQTQPTVNLSEAPINEDGYVVDEEEAQNETRAKNGFSAFNALQATLAAVNAKNEAEGPKPVSKNSGSKASNSDGVAASWADNEVREARLTRDGVSVELEGQNVGVFKSTREAFRNLRLPDNKHIRFRLKLKEAHRIDGGKETFEHNGKKYVFQIVAIDAE